MGFSFATTTTTTFRFRTENKRINRKSPKQRQTHAATYTRVSIAFFECVTSEISKKRRPTKRGNKNHSTFKDISSKRFSSTICFFLSLSLCERLFCCCVFFLLCYHKNHFTSLKTYYFFFGFMWLNYKFISVQNINCCADFQNNDDDKKKHLLVAKRYVKFFLLSSTHFRSTLVKVHKQNNTTAFVLLNFI